MELESLAVYRAGPLYGDVLCIDSKEQRPIPVLQRRIAVERNGIGRVVLLAVGSAEQFSRRCYVQGYIAL